MTNLESIKVLEEHFKKEEDCISDDEVMALAYLKILVNKSNYLPSKYLVEQCQKALDNIKEFTLVTYDEDGEEEDCGSLYQMGYLKTEINFLQELIDEIDEVVND